MGHFCLHSPIRRFNLVFILAISTPINLLIYVFLKGLVNSFLSWKLFMPLSRICYAAYLINCNVMRLLRSSQRHSSYASESYFILSLLGFVTTTFSLSFVLSLTVEMPFLNLDKLILKEKPTASATTIKQQCDRKIKGKIETFLYKKPLVDK